MSRPPPARTEDLAALAARVSAAGPLVLFDGVCNLCNGSVQFLIDHDSAGHLRFASLQGPTGQAVLAGMGLDTEAFVSILLVDRGRVLDHSAAALRIAAYLDPPWSLATRLQVFPEFLRDAVYRHIARQRYAWFGRTESCRVPAAELRSRFLDDQGVLVMPTGRRARSGVSLEK